MLSSTAGNIYWMGRYIERATNTARMLEATNRMWLMAGGSREWQSLAMAFGLDENFEKKYPDRAVGDFVTFMGVDSSNPSSIAASIQAARYNARAERNNLTVSVWEYLNEASIQLRSKLDKPLTGSAIQDFLDWTKRQMILVAGACETTLLRDEAYHFLSLGTYIERADNTARILDSKYHILLPQGEKVGGGVDYYQWTEILNCINALRTYRRVYSSAVLPWRVAELMILRSDLPRSLHFCLTQIMDNLDALAQIYGTRHECHRLCGVLASGLRYGKVDDIFKRGLHEFLVEFIDKNNDLGVEITRNYLINP
ncbi:alpha-E domain-containing protein [Elstera cyanobacteriorum]|uniref:alpha-E domain-containing protein n=1 Tax=Elstera cyanobacteriorum TaxID=2022747 RepID=UPI00235589B1|nr:alpha-E domain-containing protein [Elstera cyanobacteriorum]MCK6444044.1 alpha-E domain-containing protein [Elstera cyanobacteriorum]